MKLLRRFFWLLVVLSVLYVALWFAGFFVIRNQLEQFAPKPTTSLIDDLLDEEFNDQTKLSFDAYSISGFPFGYKVMLEKPAVSHTLIAWSGQDEVTARWSIFSPFSVRVDYAGTHIVAPALQSPMTLSADRAEAVVQVQPLFAERDVRLALVGSSGVAASAAVNDRPVFSVSSFAVELDTPSRDGPGDVLLDVFGFTLSDDPEVQARYQDLLKRLGNAESMLSALGLGLDRPIDHVRLRANVQPFFPLRGSTLALRSFIARGGNVLVEVVDVMQGNWRGRLSARVMFGPDGRTMVQSCPLLRAGSSYLPIPFMSLVTLYIGGGRVDMSRDPIPEIALPDSVEPFTQRELCDVARTHVFADEAES